MFSQQHLGMTRPAVFGWSSKRFASPNMGIFCGGMNADCMQTRPLFLRISGSSGVLKALLLERNRQLSCNPKKKKKKHPVPIMFRQLCPPLHASVCGVHGQRRCIEPVLFSFYFMGRERYSLRKRTDNKLKEM